MARILEGERMSDFPVQQSTKVELIMNPKAAKALGITILLPLLRRAEQVIERRLALHIISQQHSISVAYEAEAHMTNL